jgi:hypothetical protein
MTAGPRTIYVIEFPDGEAVEVHESFLRAPSKRKPAERKQFGQLAPETLERLMDELRGAKRLEGEDALQKHMRSVNRAIWQRRTTKRYSRVAAVICAIIALLQLFRALAGWDITLNGAAIPLWASWLASVVAGALACVGFTAS